MHRIAVTLALLPLTIIAGCSGEPAPAVGPTAERAPAFRVRADLDAGLNSGDGWAGALDDAVAVAADRPFRLRMEIETVQTAEQSAPPSALKLQYRRNDGQWTGVEAHDFPYPSRKYAVDFSDGQSLVIATGGDGEAVLIARAPDQALLVVRAAPWELDDAFKFVGQFRASDGDLQAGFSMVFGYLDDANHWRATLDPVAGIRVSRLVDGRETVLADQPVEMPDTGWVELDVQFEDDLLEISFDDDALKFTVPLAGAVPAGEFGLLVPARSTMRFRDFRIAGEPSTPRVSIVATRAYADGSATTDLLDHSGLPFIPGAGINLAERTPAWQGGMGHAEFEWPLVIRRFAEGPVTNEDGDRFEFRMVAANGAEIRSPIARVSLVVPPGHLGGTFVETPGRIGPWQTTDGALYFILEPAESDNQFMVVKSTDEGRSWQEMDGARRPATGDLEAVDARLVEGTLHILHQVTEATFYHAFATSDHAGTPDRWLLTDELATSVTAMSQMATLVVRADGSLVSVHLGDTLGYSIRSPEGLWSDALPVDEDGAPATVGPQAILGADDVVHLAYLRLDGTVQYRRLSPGNTFSPAVQLATGAGTAEADYGAVLPLVYEPGTDTVIVVYRLADGHLWERRVAADGAVSAPLQVTDRTVITDAVDSQQPAADLVLDGTTLHALFIDPETRSIHHTCRSLAEGSTWRASRVVVDGILGSWVRGNVHTRRDGTRVYGFVYDAGSFGGAGMNRYGEIDIGECCQC